MSEIVNQTSLNPESRFTTVSYADAINAYLIDPENTTLRGRQIEVMRDVEQFFRDGHTRGYINSPTGSGKTVVAVAIAQAMINGHAGRSPKILAVEPTKHLVGQTMSRDGERGFGKFAPMLSVGSYFSDSSAEELVSFRAFDVVVTTYNSFNTLGRRSVDIDNSDSAAIEAAKKVPKDFQQYAGRQALATLRKVDHFDVIILDEAHHALGPKTKALIESLPEHVIVIGLSASPDPDAERPLSSLLPIKIHEFSVTEAIQIGMLAPIVPIGIKTNIQVGSNGLFDASGDFIAERISHLATNPMRNKMIIDAARILTDRGIGTIISCMAGNEVEHARLLADLAKRAGMTAAAVHGNMPVLERKRILSMFEDHSLDILTYVGLLGEGWDSIRPKGLINARPTRSRIVSIQRPGRILRFGDTAFTVDILDKIEGESQPITVADVLNVGPIPFGTAVGDVRNRGQVDDILRDFSTTFDVSEQLESNFTSQQEMINALPRTTRGHITINNEFYAIASRISARFRGVTDEVIAWLEERTDKSIPSLLTAQGQSQRTVFKTGDAIRLLETLPVINPERYYIDEDSKRWVSEQGIVKLFGQRYPAVSSNIIKTITRNNQFQPEWRPAAILSKDTAFGQYPPKYVVRLYSTDTETIELINSALAEYYAE